MNGARQIQSHGAATARRENAEFGRPLITLPIAQRRYQNTFDKGALGFSVFLLRDTCCKRPFQVVVGRGRFRMSTKMVAKHEVADPKVASFDHTVHMKCARPDARLPEVASVGQVLFVFLDVVVPRGFS